MIYISKTFDVVTPESAEQGEFAETGTDIDRMGLTFKELVRELREYSEASTYQCTEADARTYSNCPWVTSEGDTNYRTGEVTRYSLHLDDRKDARQRRYWAKALRVAGLVKP